MLAAYQRVIVRLMCNYSTCVYHRFTCICSLFCFKKVTQQLSNDLTLKLSRSNWSFSLPTVTHFRVDQTGEFILNQDNTLYSQFSLLWTASGGDLVSAIARLRNSGVREKTNRFVSKHLKWYISNQTEKKPATSRKFSCSHPIEEWFLYFPLS